MTIPKHANKLPDHIATRLKRVKVKGDFKTLQDAITHLVNLPTIEGTEYWDEVLRKLNDGTLLSPSALESTILVYMKKNNMSTIRYKVLSKSLLLPESRIKQAVTRLKACGYITNENGLLNINWP